jgi:dTDP-4-dehydrorhamnose reductase
MSRKAVVVGGSGQLGVELVKAFRTRGWEVAGIPRAALDISDRDAVERRMAEIEPAVIVNAAAYNQVDVAEKEPHAAFAANAMGVRNLALASRQIDARMVHFSTDYVFDGTAHRPYTEEDMPRPLGAYAISKLAGEMCAQAYLDAPLIIRTSGVFGPQGLRTARGNFIELMLRLASTQPIIRVVEDHVASPTFAPALASRTVDLVERNCFGVFHAGGGTPISWFAFAKLIFEVAGLQPELKPTNEREYRTAARRPRYSALSNAKMESEGVEPFPPLDEAVRSYFEARRTSTD